MFRTFFGEERKYFMSGYYSMQYIHVVLHLVIIWHSTGVNCRASLGYHEVQRDSLDDLVDYLSEDNLLSKPNHIDEAVNGNSIYNSDETKGPLLYYNLESDFKDLPQKTVAKESFKFQAKPVSGVAEREIYSSRINIKPPNPIEINTLTRDSLVLKIGGKVIKISAKPMKQLDIVENDAGYDILHKSKFRPHIETISEETEFPQTHEVVSELSHTPASSGFEDGFTVKTDKIHNDKVHYISEFAPLINDSEDLGRSSNSDINKEIEHDYFFSHENEIEKSFDSEEIINGIPSLDISLEHDAVHNLESGSNLDVTETEEAEVIDEEITGSEENTKSRNFNAAFEGSGDTEGFVGNVGLFENKLGEDKSGRILDVFSRLNDTQSVCTTPNGEPGRCRRFRDCILSDALNGFNLFLQYMCLIRGALVGICCPDNPVIEISNPDIDNSTEIDVEDVKQPPEGCGLNTKTRIVGGKVSVPHEWTWMVALLRRNRFYCGGVIINNWYILTAAHCVLGVNVRDLTVRLGEYNFNTQNEHQEDISVSEIKRHAQFVTLTFQHDIALLKLKRRIRYSKFVGSICLPANNTARDFSDTNGTVVGWGTVSFGGAASSVLREVTIPVWRNEECDKIYVLENINESFMCAGSPENGEDACQGDSGGPLMALNDRGRWEVIGIVSWGRRCGDPVYPGVYTRVTTYLDWIRENSQ